MPDRGNAPFLSAGEENHPFFTLDSAAGIDFPALKGYSMNHKP